MVQVHTMFRMETACAGTSEEPMPAEARTSYRQHLRSVLQKHGESLVRKPHVVIEVSDDESEDGIMVTTHVSTTPYTSTTQ